jgi:hypothetical protein
MTSYACEYTFMLFSTTLFACEVEEKDRKKVEEMNSHTHTFTFLDTRVQCVDFSFLSCTSFSSHLFKPTHPPLPPLPAML